MSTTNKEPPSNKSSNKNAAELVNTILTHPKLWRATQLMEQQQAQQYLHPSLNTGFPMLDTRLQGGWPIGKLTELLFSHIGFGELRVVFPALAALSQQPHHRIAWIGTAYGAPNPRALQQLKINLSALMWIPTQTLRESLWAAEQCLASGACHAALLWLPREKKRSIHTQIRADFKVLQRLQIAAQTGKSWGIVLRPGYPHPRQLGHSPAALRLYLQPQPKQLLAHIIKRPQGWPCDPVPILPPAHTDLTQPFLRWPRQQTSQQQKLRKFAKRLHTQPQQLQPQKPLCEKTFCEPSPHEPSSHEPSPHEPSPHDTHSYP